MKAKLANLAQTELDKYERSLKVYIDLKSVIETAFDEGKIEGKIEAAKQAKIMGLSIPDISKLTGLSEDDISKL